MTNENAWTTADVLAFLAQRGRPIKENTWHGYVTRSQAPAPDPELKVGSTPRWRPDVVRAWEAARPGKGAPGRPRPRD